MFSYSCEVCVCVSVCVCSVCDGACFVVTVWYIWFRSSEAATVSDLTVERRVCACYCVVVNYGADLPDVCVWHSYARVKCCSWVCSSSSVCGLACVTVCIGWCVHECMCVLGRCTGVHPVPEEGFTLTSARKSSGNSTPQTTAMLTGQDAENETLYVSHYCFWFCTLQSFICCQSIFFYYLWPNCLSVFFRYLISFWETS